MFNLSSTNFPNNYRNLVLIDNNLHITMPVVNGHTIGTDHACQTLNAQGIFLSQNKEVKDSLLNQLDDLKIALKDKITKLLLTKSSGDAELQLSKNILAQVRRYINLLNEVIKDEKVQSAITQHYFNDYINMIVREQSNLFAMLLSDRDPGQLPHGNVRAYDFATFSVMNPYYTARTEEAARAFNDFGVRLRHQFLAPDFKLQELSIKTKIIEDVIEQYSSSAASAASAEINWTEDSFTVLVSRLNNAFKKHVQLKEDVDVTTNSFGEKITLDSLIKLDLIDENSETKEVIYNILLASGLTDDFWFSRDNAFALQDMHYVNKEQLAGNLSILVQFFIAHINFHAVATGAIDKSKNTNFGQVLNDNLRFYGRIEAALKKALTSDIKNVQRVLFDLINTSRGSLNITKELTEADFNIICTRFNAQWSTALNCSNADEFIVYLDGVDGDFFHKDGQICISFDLFLQTFFNANGRYDSFVASRQQILSPGIYKKIEGLNGSPSININKPYKKDFTFSSNLFHDNHSLLLNLFMLSNYNNTLTITDRVIKVQKMPVEAFFYEENDLLTIKILLQYKLGMDIVKNFLSNGGEEEIRKFLKIVVNNEYLHFIFDELIYRRKWFFLIKNIEIKDLVSSGLFCGLASLNCDFLIELLNDLHPDELRKIPVDIFTHEVEVDGGIRRGIFNIFLERDSNLLKFIIDKIGMPDLEKLKIDTDKITLFIELFSENMVRPSSMVRATDSYEAPSAADAAAAHGAHKPK